MIELTASCNPVTYDTFCTITGTVVDLDSGEPIQSAVVTLTPKGYNTYTGSDGYFEFHDLDPQSYTLQVSKTGYFTNRKTITPDAGDVKDVFLTLQKKK